MALQSWEISHSETEKDLLLLYWNDHFGFDPSVARYFEAHSSMRAYPSMDLPSPWRWLQELGKRWVSGERLLRDDEARKGVIALPTRPESLEGAARFHFHVSSQNLAARVMEGGQLVIEATEFEKIVKRIEQPLEPNVVSDPTKPNNGRGRPAMVTPLSDLVLSVFEARADEYRGIKQESLIKDAQDWAKKHTGQEPGRTTVQGWLNPLLKRLAGK